MRSASRLVLTAATVLVPPLAPIVAQALTPTSASAQNPLDLLRSVQQGGGWITIPIEEGLGSVQTDTIPSFGLEVDGCLTVWPGHSGSWALQAVDPISEQRFDARAAPGEGVRFSYQPEGRAALSVAVRWSEPRDTLLHVWVGVDTGREDRNPCEPRYRESAGREAASRD